MVAVKLTLCSFSLVSFVNLQTSHIKTLFLTNYIYLYYSLTFKPLQVVFPHIPTCCFEVWKRSEAGNFESFFHFICSEWRSKGRITETCALRGNRGLADVRNALQKAKAYALDFPSFFSLLQRLVSAKNRTVKV